MSLHGELLHNHYGSKDNQELLLAYGFVLQPNSADYVALSLPAMAVAGAGPGPGAEADRPGGSATEGLGPADGNGDEEADLQSAAEAVQRSLVAAAAGLPEQLHLTLADPLPEQLLQATRLALASGSRLHFAASEALMPPPPPGGPASSPPDQTATTAAIEVPPNVKEAAAAATAASACADKDSQVPTAVRDLLEPYDAVSELRVLTAVQQQLEARLGGMVGSEGEVRALLGLPAAPEPPPSAAAGGRDAATHLPPPPEPLSLLLLPGDWLRGAQTCSSSEVPLANGTSCGGGPAAAGIRHAALAAWCARQGELAERLGVGHHAALALAVVNGQRAILTAALEAVRGRMSALLMDACGSAAVGVLCSVPGDCDEPQRLQQDQGSGAPSLGSRLELREWEPPLNAAPSAASDAHGYDADGIAASRLAAVGSSPPLPCTAALRVVGEVAPGREVLRVPLAGHCWWADGGPQLAELLLLHTAALLLLPPPPGPPPPLQRQQQQEAGQQGMELGEPTSADQPAGAHFHEGRHQQPGLSAAQELLLRQLMRHVAPAPIARLVLPPGCGAGIAAQAGPAISGPQVLALLQGSPINSEYEEAVQELQDGFNALRQRLQRSLAAAPSGGGKAAPPSAACPGLSPDSRARAAQALLGLAPERLLRLYAWAEEVVARCGLQVELQEEAVEGPPPVIGRAAGAPPAAVQAQASGRHVVLLAPLLWALPKEVIEAALRLQCRPCGEGSWAAPATAGCAPYQAPPAPSPVSGAGVELIVAAACPLPGGLLLHRASLLPGCRDPDALMARWGHEALAALGRITRPEADTAAGGGGAAVAGAPAGVLSAPCHGMELLPGEEDPLRGQKLELARRCGMGSVHYLGAGGRGRALVEAALKLMLLATEAGGGGKSSCAEAAAAAALLTGTQASCLEDCRGNHGQLLAAARRVVRKALRLEVATAHKGLRSGAAKVPDVASGVGLYLSGYAATLGEWSALLDGDKEGRAKAADKPGAKPKGGRRRSAGDGGREDGEGNGEQRRAGSKKRGRKD
ncbi:hypothetical protein GPECTOR_49g549 [Gonium pectorale]|uniref:Uncharacterized protein n=1 Tax=Gonium pectorale TaxID=33097 RepID=A0A150G8T0_GONPE|nr:hypothetical protein GPECTOR_49g549 [Gonium pectorale]|eukprot:KXZ45965.1 hypothetical protein GPECTOR_49g549 [Gonium pectorale]